MSDRKCKHCKFWDHLSEEPLKECFSNKFEERGIYDEDDEGTDILAYWDYEAYMAGFSTGPNFGCIHWQPIEPPEGE